MFDRNTFGQYHNVNANTGFHPSVHKYDGYVRDAEGKPWGFIKSQNMYEQAETGIRVDPAEFQRRNIDILGYGSNDGGPSGFTVYDETTNYTTGADGIFERTSDGSLSSAQAFTEVEASSAYPPDTALSAQLINSTTIRLSDNAGVVNDAPFIGFYVEGPEAQKGWYIAQDAGSGGDYTYVRSQQRSDFPPAITNFTQPIAITYYAGDPGSVAKWTDYVT